MAANRGVTLFVLLLYCCHRAEQPVNTSSGIVAVDRVAGPPTEMSPRSKSQEHMSGLVDEILVQEILNPNKSSRAGIPRTASTLPPAVFKEKKVNTEEDKEADAEPPENAQSSPSNVDKIINDSRSNDSYQIGGSEDHDKKNAKSDHYESLSVLDKILQKIGKFSGFPSRIHLLKH